MLSKIAAVLEERQYICLNETGIGNDVQLCVEKDFWPIERKEQCLVYSFTMKENLEAEKFLMKWGCSVHFFDPSKDLQLLIIRKQFFLEIYFWSHIFCPTFKLMIFSGSERESAQTHDSKFLFRKCFFDATKVFLFYNKISEVSVPVKDPLISYEDM